MKYFESHFDEYLQESDRFLLHGSSSLPTNSSLSSSISSIASLPHRIIYGPAGVGKYTQALRLIRPHSPSQLKYEKKLQLIHDKRSYTFKISDVHMEVDMSLLGCNAKLLWHDIYQQVEDIVNAKPDKCFFVLCKHFHDIHLELLETFYSYLQTSCLSTRAYHLRFLLLTDHLSFLPDSLLQCCHLLRFSRPSHKQYNRCLESKMGQSSTLESTFPLASIRTIKLLPLVVRFPQFLPILEPHRVLCDKILSAMEDLDHIDILKFRDMLHDVFIYNVRIADCTWYIFRQLLIRHAFPSIAVQSVALVATLRFLRMINANFRPLFHLEKFLLHLTLLIHHHHPAQPELGPK